MLRIRRLRGYLLIDIAIGGALAAIGIAGMLSLLASARSKNVAATRDIIATQLVLEKIDQVRSFPYSSTALANGTDTPVTGMTGAYARKWAVAATTETVGTPAFMLNYKKVDVEVTFTSEGRTRKTQATTRVYE